MSALLKPNDFTLEEYYALDAASDRRWEYWDGDVVCMSGGTKEHGRLSTHILVMLHSIFTNKGCEAFTEAQAVKVSATNSGYVYPDASAACNAQFEKHKERGIDMLINPSILVEVTSNESGARDYNTKKAAYLEIQSLRDYLIIEPYSIHITHWKLVQDEWVKQVYDDLGDSIDLASTNETLSLSEIYRVVLFSRRK